MRDRVASLLAIELAPADCCMTLRRQSMDPLIVVEEVDTTCTHPGAFEGPITYPDDRSEDLPVGYVLACFRRQGRRWRAGRSRPDGVHWEEQTWAEDDFIAFRDHVSRLVEFAPTLPEHLAEVIANAWRQIRVCRRIQARQEDGSDWYDHFEGVISEIRRYIASQREELTALQPSSPRTDIAAP